MLVLVYSRRYVGTLQSLLCCHARDLRTLRKKASNSSTVIKVGNLPSSQSLYCYSRSWYLASHDASRNSLPPPDKHPLARSRSHLALPVHLACSLHLLLAVTASGIQYTGLLLDCMVHPDTEHHAPHPSDPPLGGRSGIDYYWSSRQHFAVHCVTWRRGLWKNSVERRSKAIGKTFARAAPGSLMSPVAAPTLNPKLAEMDLLKLGMCCHYHL